MGGGSGNGNNLVRQNPRDELVSLIVERTREAEAFEKRKKEEAREAKRIAREEKTRAREARRENKLRNAKGWFRPLFRELASSYFRLTDRDIKDLSDEQLRELEQLIAKKALAASIGSKALFQLSGVGLLGYVGYQLRRRQYRWRYEDCNPRPGRAWSYRYLRGVLRGAYGKEWFSSELVR